jgi:hypothetical protein
MTAMISVLQFVKVEDWDSLEIRSENQDVECTLEWLHDVQRPVLHLIGYSLLVLFICRPIHGKPSAASFRMILSSFPLPSSPGPSTFRSRIRRLVLRVFFHADHWFSDDELGLILEEESVWPSFARSGTVYYSILGEKLSGRDRSSRRIYPAGLHNTRRPITAKRPSDF